MINIYQKLSLHTIILCTLFIAKTGFSQQIHTPNAAGQRITIPNNTAILNAKINSHSIANASAVCPSVVSGDGILLDQNPPIPLPANFACNSPIVNLAASRNSNFGQYIVPAVVIDFTSNYNTSNSIEYYYNNTASGVGFGSGYSVPINTNTINSSYLYGVSPSATHGFNFCETNTAQPNTPFTITDVASGTVVYTGTWVDDGACQLITLPAGSVTGITQFTATCGACITANYDNGYADFSPSIAGPGTHTITYTFTPSKPGCPPYVFSETITVGPVAPTPTVTKGDSICSGTTATLTVTGTDSYLWYTTPTGGTALVNGNTYITPVLTANTTYYVEAENTAGCKSAARKAVTVVINLTPAAFNTSGITDTICAGKFVVMGTATANVTTSVYTTPTGGTPVGTINYTTPPLTTTTIYYFETKSNFGCLAKPKRDSIIIVVNPLPISPIITSLSNDSVCIGLTDSIKTTAIAGVVTNVYTSSAGGASIGTLNFQTPPIVANITYYFETKIVATGCITKTVRDSITIKTLPRPAKATLLLTPNDTLCQNDTIKLKSLATAGSTVHWYATSTSGTSIGKDSAIVAPQGTQYYYAEVKNKYGCKASETRDSVKITVLPLPNAPKLLGGVDKICEGDSIVLNALVTPATSTIYWLSSTNWKDTIAKGVNFTSPILTANTTYYLATITKENCRSKPANFYALPIIVKPLPHVTISCNANNNTVFEGESILFECAPTNYDIYKWYIDTKQVYVGGYSFETQDITGAQDVKVKVTSNGCDNWADNVLSIKAKPMSNAFSPNGDGKNDLFLKGLDLTIFNRWGQILYTGKEGWDGKYNGTLVNAGTYFYMVKIAKSGATELVEKTGAVTLLVN